MTVRNAFLGSTRIISSKRRRQADPSRVYLSFPEGLRVTESDFPKLDVDATSEMEYSKCSAKDFCYRCSIRPDGIVWRTSAALAKTLTVAYPSPSWNTSLPVSTARDFGLFRR